MGGDPCSAGPHFTDPRRGAAAVLQSARLATLHRILPDLICGQGRPPLWLGPARPSRGDARPWACGAAGPRKPAAAHCRPEAAGGRRAGRRHRRGTRAGHRVQRRRSRAGCDLDRAVRGGSAGPRDRCLVSPARLTLRQTARWEPSRPEREERHTPSIGHSNVRSIVPKMDEINRLLQQHDLDVFFATETWLTDPAQDRILISPDTGSKERTAPTLSVGGDDLLAAAAE